MSRSPLVHSPFFVYLTFIAKAFIISVTLSHTIFKPVAAFGAGNIPNFAYLNDKAFRHGDVEEILTTLVKNTHLGGSAGLWGILIAILSLGRITGGAKFNHMDAKRIYFGNWLRDYSQALDIGGLKLFTASNLRIIISVIGFMTFGFATVEFEITPERLGVYNPVEHIDNPKGYGEEEGGGGDARHYHPDLRPPVDPRELEINLNNGMKNYIATEGESWDTSTAHIRRTLLECIRLGRRSGMKEGLVQFEAFRLLGSALHTLEDLTAHSNWCELALRRMGYEGVFCHVGEAVLVDTPLGPAPPLVTGTFGSTDFIHSVLGEGMDRLAEASMSNLATKMNESKEQTEIHIPILHDLLSEFIHSKQSHNEKIEEAESMKSQAFDFDMSNITTEEVQDFIWRIFAWRDSVYKDILKTIAIIPGLSALFERLSEALNAFIYSLLDPILQDIIAHLQSHSEEVINTHEQFQVFDDPNASDPSHSVLAKDHFALILNEPAGKVARVIVEHTVTLVVKAWCEERINPEETVDKILETIHHPFFATSNSQVQDKMMECMHTWFTSLAPEDAQKVLEGLTKEGIRTGMNKRFATREELEMHEEAYKHEQELLRQARMAPPPRSLTPPPRQDTSPSSRKPVSRKKNERQRPEVIYKPRPREPSYDRFDSYQHSYSADSEEEDYIDRRRQKLPSRRATAADSDDEFWKDPYAFAAARNHKRSSTQPDIQIRSSSKRKGDTSRKVSSSQGKGKGKGKEPEFQPPPPPPSYPEIYPDPLLHDMQSGFQKAWENRSNLNNNNNRRLKKSSADQALLFPTQSHSQVRFATRKRSMSFGGRPQTPPDSLGGDYDDHDRDRDNQFQQPEILEEPVNPKGAVYQRYDSVRAQAQRAGGGSPPLFSSRSQILSKMWCDNCCLLFPLRAGAIAWGLIIAILNIAGGIILFKYGEFFFFSFNAEWNIMGALAMLVAALAFINIVALSNRSYVFARVCNFAWPFVLILSAIRDILIIVELQRGKNDIITECQNGGLLFSGSPAQPPAGTISPDPPATLPNIFCSRGFNSLNTAFIAFIVIDLILQIYMTFLNWRFVKRIQHYTALPGPLYGGYYKA
ncbi:hypothetical protein Clacol_004179 [Clathrus columnatus]|uniref:Uncharacterized protein n=1 Tax=Clathrus columnatus TaxID=1419009 RepID=A0AAV5ADF2_9AGAM|nr:hypothetical protein Clacol_004179 [Clathrus columnatus]